MFDAGSRSDTSPSVATPAGDLAAALAPVRVRGGARLVAKHDGERTVIDDLSEAGGYRLKFPTPEADHLEVVQINTGGGVVGGDRLEFAVAAGLGTDVAFATQAAERIYRTAGPAAEVAVTLQVGAGARLDWLPQETLLYSGARLMRRFDIDVAGNATLLLVECLTFGRIASGEVMGVGALQDRWRVSRNGKLIWADATRIAGDVGLALARAASGNGARAIGLVLLLAPDAEDRVNAARHALGGTSCDCGVSAWNGMLTARFLANDPANLRLGVRHLVETLAGRPLPRVWAA